jgi:hypothetical protein
MVPTVPLRQWENKSELPMGYWYAVGISHQVQRLRGGADDDEDDNYIEYQDYDEYDDQWHRQLGPLIAQSEYQHENVYSFKLNPGIHHESELNDLPDPRQMQ